MQVPIHAVQLWKSLEILISIQMAIFQTLSQFGNCEACLTDVWLDFFQFIKFMKDNMYQYYHENYILTHATRMIFYLEN